MQNDEKSNVTIAWWLLRIAYGLMPMVFGLDKIISVNKIAQWPELMSALLLKIIPLETFTALKGLGVVELIAGASILVGFTRFGGWLLVAYYLFMLANLISIDLFHHLTIHYAAGVFAVLALIWLTDVQEKMNQ